jgi:branched-chain amino acid transport system permease protein
VRDVDLRQSDEEPRVLQAAPHRFEVSDARGRARRRRLSTALVPAAGLAVAGIVPLFVGEASGLLENMVLAAAYVIMALGLNIVVGFAGLLDLGYVAFFAIGAHVAAYFGSGFWSNAAGGRGIDLFVDPRTASAAGIHANFLIILGLAVIATTIAGVLIGVPTLRLRGDYVAMVTLAFGEIIGQIVYNGQDIQLFGGSLTQGPSGITALDRIDLPFVGRFGLLDLRPWCWFALALVALMLFVNVRLRNSRLGRAWIALRDDERAAASAGVPIVRTKLRAYGVGAALGGVAGAFLASYLSIVNPTQFTFSFSIFILAMVVLGGLGSIWGVVLGALILSLFNNYLLPRVLYGVPGHLGLDLDLTEVASGIYGFLLVIVMLLRPQGLLPEGRRRVILSRPLPRICAERARVR